MSLLDCEFEPFDIFGISTECKSGEFPIFLDDAQSVFMRSHVGIIPRQIAVVRQYGQFIVGCVAEQTAIFPRVLLYG